jgi:hypothetical protein
VDGNDAVLAPFASIDKENAATSIERKRREVEHFLTPETG